MTIKTYETVIIGAGISGLACAYHLQKLQQDFLLISSDIGGRIRTSEDGTANYGAFFVCADYENVLPFVTIKEQIRLQDFCFHENDDTFVLHEPQLLLYLTQFMKIKRLLYRFRDVLADFRKTTETLSQKKTIEADPLLHGLYMRNAADFVKDQCLTRGTEKYLSKALYATTFSAVHEMNAFSFLQFLLPLITPIFTFRFEQRNMTAAFREKTILDTATDISFSEDQYKIKTRTDAFYAKNLVLATELGWSAQYAGIREMNKPVNTYMFHIRGAPKQRIARKPYHLFCHPSMVQAIADLHDGTYLFYSKDDHPSFETFFHTPQILMHHHWDPAGRINGHVLLESQRGNHLYLIGDFNVAGLEETYITGLYAANQIIASQQ